VEGEVFYNYLFLVSTRVVMSLALRSITHYNTTTVPQPQNKFNLNFLNFISFILLSLLHTELNGKIIKYQQQLLMNVNTLCLTRYGRMALSHLGYCQEL